MSTHKKILITQVPKQYRGEVYQNLCDRYDVEIDFFPFTITTPISAAEFLEQGIHLPSYETVVFASREVVGYYFQMYHDLGYQVDPETRYICSSEMVAVHLGKFINIKKRKLLFSEDSSIERVCRLIQRRKKDHILYPCSPEFPNPRILRSLKKYKCEHQLATLYHVYLNADIQHIGVDDYDMLCFLSPGGLRSMFASFPHFDFSRVQVGIYGKITREYAEAHGVPVHFFAPNPTAHSMIDALAQFLAEEGK